MNSVKLQTMIDESLINHDAEDLISTVGKLRRFFARIKGSKQQLSVAECIAENLLSSDEIWT